MKQQDFQRLLKEINNLKRTTAHIPRLPLIDLTDDNFNALISALNENNHLENLTIDKLTTDQIGIATLERGLPKTTIPKLSLIADPNNIPPTSIDNIVLRNPSIYTINFIDLKGRRRHTINAVEHREEAEAKQKADQIKTHWGNQPTKISIDFVLRKKLFDKLFNDTTVFNKVRQIRVTNKTIEPAIFKDFINTLLPACPDLMELIFTDYDLPNEMGNYLLDYLIAHPANCLSKLSLPRNMLTSDIIAKLSDLLHISDKIISVQLPEGSFAEYQDRSLLNNALELNQMKANWKNHPTIISIGSQSAYSHFVFNKKIFDKLFDDMAVFDKVRQILITNTKMEPDIFKKLINALLPACPNLAEFQFAKCSLTDEMGNYLLDYLITHPENCPSKLYLPDNELTNGIITKVSDLLHMPNKIVAISLNGNKIDATSGLFLLGSELKENKTLVSFCCMIDELSDHDAKNFIDLINSNRALMEVQLFTPLELLDSYGWDNRYERQQQKRENDKKLRPITKYVERNSKNKTLLFSYISSENIQEMEKLFEAGISMYTYNERNGDSLLHVAVQQGKTKVVQYLLSRNFNRKTINHEGKIAREMISPTDNAEIIALLEAEYPVPPVVMKKITNVTPSCKKRKAFPIQSNTLDNFITQKKPEDSNCNPNKKLKLDNNQSTLPTITSSSLALQSNMPAEFLPHSDLPYFMALNGNAEFFRTLPTDFDANKPYQNECTLLHAAALYGHTEIIAILLNQHHAIDSVNKPNHQGQTPLHYTAIFADKYPPDEAAGLLLEHEANVDTEDIYGMTPLYLLAGGFDANANANRDVESRYLKKLARLFIENNADVNKVICDLELNIANFSLLHKAVVKNNYHLVSEILSSKNCNLALQDANGNTAFHLAILHKRVSIFEKMIHIPGARSACEVINAANQDIGAQLKTLNQTLNTEPELAQLSQLYNDFMKQPSPTKVSGIRWVNRFSFFYGSRHKEKVCSIDLDDIHSGLAQSITQKQTTKTVGNTVAAALSFVVSTQSSIDENEAINRRTLITIKLDDSTYKHVTDAWQQTESINGSRRSPDMKQRILRRLQNLSVDFELSDNITTRTAALSSNAVETLYQQPAIASKPNEPTFEQLFHHGEQSLLDFLEEDSAISEIISKLKASQNFTPGCKIYAVVLSLYSPRYVCKNCEAAIIGEQNSQQSIFLTKLRNALQKENCIIAHNNHLHMLTCVSSKIPPRDMNKKRIEDHHTLQIDLRFDHGHLVLQKDMETMASPVTVFGSRRA